MITPVSGNHQLKPATAPSVNPQPKTPPTTTAKANTAKVAAPAADKVAFSQQAQQASKNVALEKSKAHEATESPVVEAHETKQQGFSQLQSLLNGGK